MEEACEIVGISFCELSRDGGGANVSLERSDGTSLKLSLTMDALTAVAARLGYESIRRTRWVASGQKVGQQLLEASAKRIMGTDQINIGFLLPDGVLLQFQIDDTAAIPFATELVTAAQELAHAPKKPLQ